MQATFKQKISRAKNIFSFVFEPEQPLSYQPGQYTELTLPHQNEDDRGSKRWFTLSSSPTESSVFITTKLATEKGSTFKAALANLAPGTKVDLAAAEGDFTLPTDPAQPLIFVAGGIGVTPFRSIIQYLTDKKEKRPIQLLYAANSPGEIAFRDLFDNNPSIEEVKYVVKEATDGWGGAVGILDAAKIAELSGGLDGKEVYISGPEPMVKALQKALEEGGLDSQRVKIDDFPNYTADY